MRAMLLALAGLLLAACGDTYNVYEGDDTVIHEAPEVVDTDIVVEETDTGDTAVENIDIPDILGIDFTTAWGPIGHIQLRDTVSGVNVGGLFFTVDGDEAVTVSRVPVPMWWNVGSDAFARYSGWPAEDFVLGCQLVNAAPPFSGEVATAVIDSANGELVFSESFVVSPGPTSGRAMNVICDFVADPSLTPTSFAIDLPSMDGVVSDADRRPELPEWSYDPGNYNGQEFPSRSVILP